ncbi:MAG TPA: tryptophan--tRNA ligase [Candidatus Sulfotelmatobacter sp.]|nr:tryptophan--tRNA ligase [Candidatus Sulfotelmatobacter sp.]
MPKTVILTGLRANNDLHIGNYLGALKPIVDLAKNADESTQINLFVPDLHSFTTPIEHGSLSASITTNLKLYVAAGLPLDKPNVYIYRQSYIPAHSELTWILDCFAGYGELQRMTQFKDKSASVGNERISMGLLNYPVLMAADILLYGANYIPVGDDQTQHLEFTRDLAERMNKQFGDIFVVPLPVAKQHEFFNKDQGLRVKDLSDPTKKMSKSSESSKGVIFLTDSIDEAKAKVLSATTDSLNAINYNKETQPGVSNLMDLVALLTDTPLDQVIAKYKDQTSYASLKSDVATAIENFLKEFQGRLSSVDENAIKAKLESSESAMNTQANETLIKVQKAVGLRA